VAVRVDEDRPQDLYVLILAGLHVLVQEVHSPPCQRKASDTAPPLNHVTECKRVQRQVLKKKKFREKEDNILGMKKKHVCSAPTP